MALKDIFRTTKKSLALRSPEILTGLSVGGVITTSYLTAKGTIEAVELVKEAEDVGHIPEDRKEKVKTITKIVWRSYIPAGISAAFTVGCIVGASKASNKRTAAAVTAFSITEKAFDEYRAKVIDEIGAHKERAIRDAVAQDKVQRQGDKEVIITGSGDVMCCELYTHRYFKSDMESLRRAENEINYKITRDLYVTLDELYDILGLPHTQTSNKIGWDSKLVEFIFSTVLSESGQPCLAFEYNYIKPL